jgi:hypothetical protein
VDRIIVSRRTPGRRRALLILAPVVGAGVIVAVVVSDLSGTTLTIVLELLIALLLLGIAVKLLNRDPIDTRALMESHQADSSQHAGSGVADGEDADDDESRVLSEREAWIPPMVWSTWQESARRADRLSRASALVVVTIGALLLLAAVRATIPDVEQGVVVGAYGLVFILVPAWNLTRTVVQRRLFKWTAAQMVEVMVPALLDHPERDGLFNLARRGVAGFVPESIVVRAVKRDAAIYLVATEYDVTKDWIGGGGDAGGG